MSLLEEIKKIGELEQQSMGGKWSWEAWNDGPLLYSTEYKNGDEDFNPLPGVEMDLLVTLRNLAPAMLEVLGCFQKGDAETLGEILDVFQFDGEPMSGVYAACIKRLQEAASLMEQEAR